jgi:excisionase family DNA binding protein
MIDPAIFAPLDEAIRAAAPEDRPGLVVGLAARIITLGALGLAAASPAPAPADGVTKEYLTYKQAADYLGRSVSYVETLVRQGKLSAMALPGTDKGTGAYRKERQGRGRRIPVSALRALLVAFRNTKV